MGTNVVGDIYARTVQNASISVRVNVGLKEVCFERNYSFVILILSFAEAMHPELSS